MNTNISRRNFVKAGAVAGMGLGLAACGGNSGSSNGSSSDTIKIGLMGPYTGDVAQYGLACRYGAELYVKQVNDKGGINGKQVELDTQDEKGDATEAVNVYNKLVEDGVVGIIGDVTSTPTIAVAQASVKDNMPCVTPSATAADVISYGNNYFRACITDPYQGKLMADFAADQGYKTVGVIYNQGGDYEQGVADAFTEEAGKKGITVSDSEGYPSGATDFNSQLTNIISTNPDAIFSPNYYQDDGKIVTQARKLGYTGVFMGADGWSNIVGGDEEYASAEDLEGCYYDCSFVSENEDEKVQDFIKAYKDEYNDTPSNFCALGYDAAMILLNAIETVEKDGKATYGSDDYKQAIVDAIASGTANGVTGDISYSGTGDPVKSTLIITFKDGAQEVFKTVEGK